MRHGGVREGRSLFGVALLQVQERQVGGGAPAPDRDSDEFKAVLREEQERVKAEYEGKIRELEADRQEAAAALQVVSAETGERVCRTGAPSTLISPS